MVFIRDSSFVFADGSAERSVFLRYRSFNAKISMEAKVNENTNIETALDAALDKWSTRNPEKRKLAERELLDVAEAYMAQYGLMALIGAIYEETAFLYQS